MEIRWCFIRDMESRNTLSSPNGFSVPQRYSLTARLFHWGMAAIIIPVWMIGFSAGRLLPRGPSPLKGELLSIHKEIASTIIILVVLRMAWRATHRPPALPDSVPEEQQIAARVLQGCLYLLMLSTPLTGWLMASAHGAPVQMLWIVHLPALIQKTPLLAPTLGVLHQFSAWILGVLIAGHIVAALMHRFSKRDQVMEMML